MTENIIKTGIASSLWLSEDCGSEIDLCPIPVNYKSEDNLLKSFKRALKQAHDDIHELSKNKWNGKALIAKFHFIGEDIFESDWSYRELKRINKSGYDDETILQKIAVSNSTDNYGLISEINKQNQDYEYKEIYNVDLQAIYYSDEKLPTIYRLNNMNGLTLSEMLMRMNKINIFKTLNVTFTANYEVLFQDYSYEKAMDYFEVPENIDFLGNEPLQYRLF